MKLFHKIKMYFDAINLCKSCNFQMDKIAVVFSKRAIEINKVRTGFIIHTKNRGIIELIGTDNIIEEIVINPQLEAK